MIRSIFHGYFLLLTIAFFPLNTMSQHKYTIQVDLQSSQQEVWSALTDFQSYPQWNSVLVMQDNDQLEVGKKFRVTIINANGKNSKFKAKTLTKDAQKSFSARQVILGKWFFSATHHFIVEGKGDSTTFTQTWYFTGILFPPMKKVIYKQLDRFNQMNADLKGLVES